MFCLRVGDFADAVGVELVNAGVRVGQDDRRVGGDDELPAAADVAVQQREKLQLPRGRQRGLWLVQEVQAVVPEAVDEEREERLAVRLLVEGPVPYPPTPRRSISVATL